jgi:hypothetical protein
MRNIFEKMRENLRESFGEKFMRNIFEKMRENLRES